MYITNKFKNYSNGEKPNMKKANDFLLKIENGAKKNASNEVMSDDYHDWLVTQLWGITAENLIASCTDEA